MGDKKPTMILALTASGLPPEKNNILVEASRPWVLQPCCRSTLVNTQRRRRTREGILIPWADRLADRDLYADHIRMCMHSPHLRGVEAGSGFKYLLVCSHFLAHRHRDTHTQNDMFPFLTPWSPAYHRANIRTTILLNVFYLTMGSFKDKTWYSIIFFVKNSMKLQKQNKSSLFDQVCVAKAWFNLFLSATAMWFVPSSQWTCFFLSVFQSSAGNAKTTGHMLFFSIFLNAWIMVKKIRPV